MIQQASKCIAVAALVVVSACGGGNDGGEGPDWASSVDSATATQAGQDAGDFANGVAYYLLAETPWSGYPTGWVKEFDLPLVQGTDTPTSAEQLIARVRADAYRRGHNPEMAATPSPFRVSTVCVPVETGVDALGNWIDTDRDLIPDDYTLAFPANCIETHGDWTYTYSGSLRFRDQAGLYGYRLDISSLTYRFDGPDVFEQHAVNGFEVAAYTANAITHSTDLVYDETYQQPSIGSGGASFTYKESTSYDPVGTISLDAPIPNGTLTASLDFRDLRSGYEGSSARRWTMVTTVPLSINTTICNSPVSGTIVGDLNGDGNIGFTVVFTGCRIGTITTRGTTES